MSQEADSTGTHVVGKRVLPTDTEDTDTQRRRMLSEKITTTTTTTTERTSAMPDPAPYSSGL